MVARRVFGWVLAAGVAVVVARAAGVSADGQPAPVAGSTVTFETLPALLKAAGLEPRDGGSPGRLRIDRGGGGGGFYAFLALSPNGQYVWISTPLADLPKERPLPRGRLLEMLAANAADDGVHFALVGNTLHLLRAVDNRGLVPAAFGREIDTFFGVLVKTNLSWNVTRWSGAPTPGAGMGDAPPAGAPTPPEPAPPPEPTKPPEAPTPAPGVPAMTEGR